jgi:hypothetical protein
MGIGNLKYFESAVRKDSQQAVSSGEDGREEQDETTGDEPRGSNTHRIIRLQWPSQDSGIHQDRSKDNEKQEGWRRCLRNLGCPSFENEDGTSDREQRANQAEYEDTDLRSTDYQIARK